MATMLLFNGLLHALGSVVTRAYSPGVASGYPPIWVAALRYGRKLNPRLVAPAVVVGLLLHAVVLVAAFAR